MLRTFVILVALLSPVALADVPGQASVIDGDSIEGHGTRIRLHGIDAPESGQLCYIGGKRWRCGKDAANAAWLVGNGLALAYRRYSTAYVPHAVHLLEAARLRMRGMMP